MYVKLFVGNLPWSVGDEELESLFQPHGEVQRSRVITDRATGRSRGFGFVEMETDDVAALINATNDLEVRGRLIRVNEAEERSRSPVRSHEGGDSGGRHDSGFSDGSRRDSRGGGSSRGDRYYH